MRDQDGGVGDGAGDQTGEGVQVASGGANIGEARIVGDEPPVKGLGIAKGARRPGRK